MFLKAPWNLMHKLSLIVLMRKPRMKEEISGPESKAEGKWANKTVVGFPVGRLVIVRTSAKQRSREGSFHEFISNSAIILSRKHYFNPSKHGVFFLICQKEITLYFDLHMQSTPCLGQLRVLNDLLEIIQVFCFLLQFFFHYPTIAFRFVTVFSC